MGTFREHLDKYSLFSGRNILVRKLAVWSVSVDAFGVLNVSRGGQKSSWGGGGGGGMISPLPPVVIY